MKTKIGRIGAAVAVAALAIAAIQIVTSAPAAAVAGLIRVPGPVTPDNGQVLKSISAQCPATSPRIVGGGIVINDHGQGRVFARFMQPTKVPNGRDFYSVAAASPPGFVGTYSLQAIAVCASNAGVPGHEVVPGTPTPPSSSTAQDDLVHCSSTTKRVIGFGGGVLSGSNEVGLQTVRSTGPRDGSRAFAREDSSYTPTWQVQAFAICMTSNNNTPPSGAPVPGLTATTLCSDSPNSFVHGPGGGSWEGTGWIHRIQPAANLKQTTVTVTPGSTAAFTSVICLP